MQITDNGLKKPFSEDFIEAYNSNVIILDEHLNDTDIHVDAVKIAEITESDELSQIDSTDTNSTMWGKIKKSISILDNHVETVASQTTLGHVKIGTGLQMTDDVASVKIADNLGTEDDFTALSAKMGKKLDENKAPKSHASTATTYGLGNASSYGHVKLSDNYVSSEGAASAGVGASSKAISDVYNTINTDLADVKNGLPIRPIQQKGYVEDCLQETIEVGYYQYLYTAQNRPSNAAGIIITVPWFEEYEKWENKYSFRIAIDTNQRIYTSVYRSGESWGDWINDSAYKTISSISIDDIINNYCINMDTKYLFHTTNIMQLASELGTTNQGYLEIKVMDSSKNWVIVQYENIYGGTIYRRLKSNGSWQSWKRIDEVEI
ncbi:pyocin knob domain-containing protein [Lachnotalea glycerini]|uniref:Uncharacterized protein n=1 Tax=Lachnotalea glycerini TaxID=1763509 RepID=A0A371JC71_9FIRM|nr:pyocin knob domain-containing protein [Lachnotalea glycerini]RDY30359.1 hypothetical protein CG710_014965 [Lachnotalea glycerini]